MECLRTFCLVLGSVCRRELTAVYRTAHLAHPLLQPNLRCFALCMLSFRSSLFVAPRPTGAAQRGVGSARDQRRLRSPLGEVAVGLMRRRLSAGTMAIIGVSKCLICFPFLLQKRHCRYTFSCAVLIFCVSGVGFEYFWG